jgi:glycine/D-amino acid oxidase-like deaminating enzyme
VVDDRPPLSLTSDKSTEAYRNWWPGPDDAMVRLMSRSIDLLEGLADSSANVFQMNRRGYVYATADPAHAGELARAGETAAAQGAGPLRHHPGPQAYTPAAPMGYRDQPAGADLLLEPALIRRHFPYLSPATVAVLHARRCGWLSGQQLGTLLLDLARARGVQVLAGRVEGVETAGGRVRGVRVAEAAGPVTTLATGCFVDAAGPFVGDVARLLGVELPVHTERHFKAALEDRLGAVPRNAPLLIWDDAQRLDWSAEERAGLMVADTLGWMLESLPAGAHLRPEGYSPDSRAVLVLWAYHLAPTPTVFPLPADPYFPELVLRGVSTMVPGLRPYLERLPRMFVDGGYYTKAADNRPLVGPLSVDGAYVLGALSGYGLMAACAAGELLAAHVAGEGLPAYAPAFLPDRFADPAYVARFAGSSATGQL